MASDAMKLAESMRGYSLMELMAALAIVAVLSAIAIPSYTAYIARGKRAEGRAALLEATGWMERWRTERGRYDDPANANNPPPGFPWAQIPRVGTANYTVAVVATPATYTITATAVGSMATDPCATLSIDQTGQRTFTGASGSQEVCWNR